MKLLLGVLAAFLLFAIPVKASPTAGALTTLCGSKTDTDVAICIGYVAGWADAIDGIVIVVDGKALQVVFADNVTTEQVIRVFVKHIADHPELENKSASGELANALIETKLMGFKPVTQDAQEH